MRKYTLKSMTINHYKFIPQNGSYDVYHKNELLGTSWPDNIRALINYAMEV